MAARRFAVALVILGVIAAACGGDSGGADGGSIDLSEPIGSADTDPGTAVYTEDGHATIEPGPSVIKTAFVEMEVERADLNSAAQSVVDLATTPKTGGFLVSSVVDTNDGYGFGNVAIKVPAMAFERVVGDLENIGDITRQQLEGQDLTDEVLGARSKQLQERSRVQSLLRRLDRDDLDAARRFGLQQELGEARSRLAAAQRAQSSIHSQTAYSTIDVAISGIAPPPPPEKPALERAVATAKELTLGIASAAVLAAGVMVPMTVLMLVLYFVGIQIVRRMRPRLGG